ncbi:MAG: TonB-dependent receptor, partial [Saprospiraceae bacterium]|nr:TonB-dependent receptor [Saprospiraceae bacterium]
TRNRNYFNPDIYVPSLAFNWKINTSTEFNWTTSAVLGQRNSVQFLGFADARDTISATTLQYATRQVDIDGFNSYASEARLRHDYHLFWGNTVVTGVRYVNNDLHRRQQGKGTTGTDFDLTVPSGQFGRDIHFKTQNVAVFVENLFKINSRLEFSAGVRYENGQSDMTGRISYLTDEKVPQDIIHQYLLAGASAQYRLNDQNKIYGSWSQAYRPVVFADIIPGSILEQTDPLLKDAFGYNSEIGLKGQLFKRLNYDVNFFQILYQNRIGSQVLTDNQGASYVWKTNIGDSRTNGVELYADVILSENTRHKISVFTASSWFDGYYLNGKLRNGSENTDITGNRLETVPKWMSRNGLQGAYKKFSAILQYSYVAESYSDALNTVEPSANGARGIVPEYAIWDINASYRINSSYTLRFGVNNFTNKQYFTKRPTGYPGQGVWSSDGRSIVASVGIRL